MNKLNSRRITQMATRQKNAYDRKARERAEDAARDRVRSLREAYGLIPIDGLDTMNPVEIAWLELQTEMDCLRMYS